LAAIDAGATHLLTGDWEHFGPYYRQEIGSVLICHRRSIPRLVKWKRNLRDDSCEGARKTCDPPDLGEMSEDYDKTAVDSLRMRSTGARNEGMT